MKKPILLVASLILLASCGQNENSQTSTTDDIVVVSTEYGDIYIALYDDTPVHKENFLKLAEEGFYDSTTFHRVIEGFMIQGGDPNSKDDNTMNDGRGGPGYTLEAEFNTDFIHKRGALAAARLGDQQNPERKSSGSQFYIVHGREVADQEMDQMEGQINNQRRQQLIREYVELPENEELLQKVMTFQQQQRLDSLQAILLEVEPKALEGFEEWEYSPEQRSAYQNYGGVPFLDQNYTVFGEVVEGLSVVDSLVLVETDNRDRPLEDVMITMEVRTLSKDEITEKFGFSYN